jgi:copper homeostasis protein
VSGLLEVPGRDGLLEVVVRHAADAERAEAGGADRLHLLSGTEEDPRSPEPALVGQVRRRTSLPIRVTVRLREGFSTDGGELVRLQGLVSAYRQAGADGLVLGFLNAHTEIDGQVLTALVGQADPSTSSGRRLGWTFDRAVDACISLDRAWRELRRLPGLDAVLTAGSPRGVTEGLDELVNRARTDDFARSVIMAGGGLLPEHVPWLARAGIRAFQVGPAVRPLGSTKAYVDPDLVRTWRRLVDDAVRR